MKLNKLLPRLELMHRERLNSHDAYKASLSSLFEAINTPIALSIYMRLKYNADGYPEVHPFMYDLLHDGVHKYQLDAQALALVSKSAILKRGVDTTLAAKKALIVSEKINKDANDRLWPYLYNNEKNSLRMHSLINSARDYLANLLGPATIDWRLVFTGGSTATVRGSEEKLLVNKITQKPSITKTALRHFYEAIWRDPAAYAFAVHHQLIDGDNRLVLDNFEITPNEIVEFVPKNWKTDRLICLQATLNMCLQKNVGDHLKGRLSHVLGINLGHVPELHEQIVQCGIFRNQMISTIDLKAASDRISDSLVKLLLPPEWYSLLNDLRHKTWNTSDDPELSCLGIHPERFSAMGNGFTFELETIIFMAICHAVMIKHTKKQNLFSVFGDDIIIPTYAATDLVNVLTFFGFETNNEKTFINSPFLESCGRDVYYHSDSRPIYLKDFDKGLRGHYELLNRIRAIARFLPCRSSALYRCWVTIIRKIRDCSSLLLCAGPSTIGDTVIHCSRSDAIRLQFGNIPTHRDQILGCEGIYKKTKNVDWIFDLKDDESSAYLELAYMCLGARPNGQYVTIDRFVSKVRRTQIVYAEHDWL